MLLGLGVIGLALTRRVHGVDLDTQEPTFLDQRDVVWCLIKQPKSLDPIGEPRVIPERQSQPIALL